MYSGNTKNFHIFYFFPEGKGVQAWNFGSLVEDETSHIEDISPKSIKIEGSLMLRTGVISD